MTKKLKDVTGLKMGIHSDMAKLSFKEFKAWWDGHFIGEAGRCEKEYKIIGGKIGK